MCCIFNIIKMIASIKLLDILSITIVLRYIFSVSPLSQYIEVRTQQICESLQ